MYQVLLVDDEPLILSGIKFMLDWNKNNCQIAGTARNGQQAMEKIRTLHPDIVICDIAMPGMTGTELLQLAVKEFPHVVFIMLTNHPDFQLAQHSLRYRAVDYLLKSDDLEPEALERSLAAAQAECRTRAKLNRVEMVDDYLEHNRQNMLEKAFLSLMQSQTLFLLCWQLEDDAWKSRLRIFAEKAGAACRTIAKTELSVMGTSCFAGPEGLERCRRQLFGLRDNYYYFGSNAMFYEDFAPVKWGSLALGGIGDRLQTEIHAKNAAACELLLKRAIDRVSTVPHQQSQALWLCGGIYSAVAAFLEIDTAKGRQSIELFRAVEQALGKREIIAEDLGYMSDTVRQLVRDSGFPGMKVLEFAFDSRDTGSASDYLPHNYPVNSVAYTGTHDNETLVSWYQAVTDAERAMVRDYLYDYATPDEQLYKSMIALILRSAAATCIIPMQDWLGLDDSARINKPSTVGQNWRWRLKKTQLTKKLQKEICQLTTRYGRMNWA